MLYSVLGMLVMVSVVATTAVVLSAVVGALVGQLLGFTRFEGTLLCLLSVVGALVALSSTATAYAVRSDLDSADMKSALSRRKRRG